MKPTATSAAMDALFESLERTKPQPHCPLCDEPWTQREATCPKGLWLYICDNPDCLNVVTA